MSNLLLQMLSRRNDMGWGGKYVTVTTGSELSYKQPLIQCVSIWQSYTFKEKVECLFPGKSFDPPARKGGIHFSLKRKIISARVQGGVVCPGAAIVTADLCPALTTAMPVRGSAHAQPTTDLCRSLFRTTLPVRSRPFALFPPQIASESSPKMPPKLSRPHPRGSKLYLAGLACDILHLDPYSGLIDVLESGMLLTLPQGRRLYYPSRVTSSPHPFLCVCRDSVSAGWKKQVSPISILNTHACRPAIYSKDFSQ